ncbi:MAG: hypothetical protein ACI8R4_001394, partial [Paracoccaceae bacterium]
PSSSSSSSLEIVIVVMLLQFGSMNQINHTQKIGHSHLMLSIQTDPALLAALKKAAGRRLSAEQLHRQKISFIMGSLNDESTITRDRIEEELNKLVGDAA